MLLYRGYLGIQRLQLEYRGSLSKSFGKIINPCYSDELLVAKLISEYFCTLLERFS